MRILLIEDKKRLSETIKKGLVEENFAVDQAFDGEEGLYLAQSETYDAIILDGMLPKMDGLVVCQEIRKKKINTPVLMLTARARLSEKVSGLDAGADDYLTKPFAFIELRSRINALLRRSHNQVNCIITIADLEVCPLKHYAKRGDTLLKLNPKEFSILEFLARHKEEAVTRSQIIEHTWDYNFDSMSNVVDVYLANLRKKIDGKYTKKLLHTIHGVGYKLSDKK